MQAALAKLSTAEQAMKTGEKAREEAERHTRAAQRALGKWELWWSRVTSRVGTGFLSNLKWLGRPPRPALDARSGGGQ